MPKGPREHVATTGMRTLAGRMEKATLTTTGRKTGKPRSVRLYAFEDGDRLVIVGLQRDKGTRP